MHISLKPEIIGYFLGLPISNSLILSLIATLLLIGLAIFAVKSMKMTPGKIQNAAESLIETLLDFMAGALGSKKQAMQFFPLVASFFLIILFNNWLGVMPGVGSVMIEESHAVASEVNAERFPLFRAANSDLNTTLALALVSVLAIQWYGVKKFGFFGHFSKFFVFTKGPLHLFVGLLELVGELAKVLSFSFRLFGNVFAGEVLLVTIMTLAPIIAPLPFFLLEFFVGFIQALVFSMLTLVFLKIATEKAEH